MKKQYIYSALILTAVLTAGCAKEFENTLDSSDNSAIELSSVSTDPMTKAVITGTSFTTDEAAAGIGLFLLDGSGNAYGKNAGNVRYGYSDGKWTAASPLRIGNTEGTLVGYYPYSSTVTDITAIPVASSINGIDYLFGSIEEITSAKAKSESLTLSHALTRLRITFKRDASFVGTGTLSSLSIEGNGVAASGTLNATSGEITATKSAFTVSDINASISTGLTEDCLVVPAAASDTPQAVILRFTVDGKSYKVDLTDGLAVKLQSGIQTDITLTVKNTSVTVDDSSIGAWGDGGSQTVTVGGDYKVTIAYSSDTGIDDDVWIKNVEVENNSVVVTAQSFFDKHLKCTMPDGEFCTSQSKEYGPVHYNSQGIASGYEYYLYTFTISDITENTTATIGYAAPVSISVTPDNSGSVKITGDAYEGETVTLAANPAYEYGFDAWLDKDGDALSCEEETYSNPVRLSSNGMSVRFKKNLILGGEFSVADHGRAKIRFTRGNLYFDGSSKVEQHQYDYNSSQWTSQIAHVSHFMWSNNISDATRQLYNTGMDGQSPFFTEVDGFTVSGFSENQCRTLTTEEWQYLFSYGIYDNDVRRGKYKLGVTVCGKNNCIVLLPDNGTWGANENKGEYNYVEWKHMEAAGAVCLPAVGFRDGSGGNTDVGRAGSYGYYWSASSSGDDGAFDLHFDSGDVNPGLRDDRNQAYSVRLVTESK